MLYESKTSEKKETLLQNPERTLNWKNHTLEEHQVQNDKTNHTYTKMSVHACISCSASQILVFSAQFITEIHKQLAYQNLPYVTTTCMVIMFNRQIDMAN